MQDRYAGDVGDFGKYALLNWLCAGDGSGRPALTLGVLWYRFTGAEPNAPNDGRHVRYLEAPRCREFRSCAPDLWERMREVVLGERSIAAVEASGALPEGTACYAEPLWFERGEPHADREAKRRGWLEVGRRTVAGADLVFLDPDNGFESKHVKPHYLRGPKYVYCGDMEPHIKARQSLVVYHHLARNKPHEEQIADRLGALRARFGSVHDIFAVRYRRGTPRAYFVLPGPERATLLKDRVRCLLASEWGRREHYDRCLYA